MEAGNNVHTDSRDQIQHESQRRVNESTLNREGLREGEAERVPAQRKERKPRQVPGGSRLACPTQCLLRNVYFSPSH